MSEKIFNISGVNYKCIFMYGYNDHYYATVYNDDEGRYIGQIVDIESCDKNVERRLINFLKTSGEIC